MESWVKRYMPIRLSDVIGQDEAVRQLASFVRTFRKGRAALLFGPVGTGKTAAVHALGNEIQHEVIELNASDYRDKESLMQVVGMATKQQSLFFRSKIILIDEVDGLSGQQDHGGIASLGNFIAESAFPLVFTANDPNERKLSALRKKSQLIEFKALGYLDVYAILEGIAKKEKICFKEEDLKRLARRSGGDARAAINDLQAMSGGGSFVLDESSDRERREAIPDALVRIFKTTDPFIAKEAIDSIDEDVDTILHWIDENLPKEYTKPADIAAAMDMISKADVFRGRIRRWQHWRFLVYIYALLSLGVSSAKSERPSGLGAYEQPKRFLWQWIANAKNAKRLSVAEKLAPTLHSSLKATLQETLPYVRVAAKKQPQFAKQLAAFLDLGPEEEAWLKGKA
ncbi:MAG: replication factor C large subunit [Nanoarchaeota archaeon]